jgi:hypothetical protein
VGSIGAVVEVGTTVGRALVGTEVGVNATIGASSAVQAVRINKEMTMMNFFIHHNYMSLRAEGEAISHLTGKSH